MEGERLEPSDENADSDWSLSHSLSDPTAGMSNDNTVVTDYGICWREIPQEIDWTVLTYQKTLLGRENRRFDF